MLTPVLIRASYKITTAELVVLETLIGSNLPLLFPEVSIMCRTATDDAVTVSGQVRTLFTNQPDPDFDGAVLFAPFSSFSVGDGATASITGLPYSLLPASYGVTTEITLTHVGPAAESEVSLICRGMVETGVSPDAGVVINV